VRDLGIGQPITPKSVQKLQTASHAKAKAEAGYRFYALYDEISRGDILAHAYAQCRSNKGAPGVDGQDFADIEAYGGAAVAWRTGYFIGALVVSQKRSRRLFQTDSTISRGTSSRHRKNGNDKTRRPQPACLVRLSGLLRGLCRTRQPCRAPWPYPILGSRSVEFLS
jgi:hypothetical protein